MQICQGPASAGSRGYPQGAQRQREREREREREKTREASLDKAKSARQRERERPDGGGRVWLCFIFYRGFYILN